MQKLLAFEYSSESTRVPLVNTGQRYFPYISRHSRLCPGWWTGGQTLGRRQRYTHLGYAFIMQSGVNTDPPMTNSQTCTCMHSELSMLSKLICSHLFSVRKLRIYIYTPAPPNATNSQFNWEGRRLRHWTTYVRILALSLLECSPLVSYKGYLNLIHLASQKAWPGFRPTINHGTNEEVTRAIVDGVSRRRVWFGNFCSAKVLAPNDTRIANRRLKDTDHVSG